MRDFRARFAIGGAFPSSPSRQIVSLAQTDGFRRTPSRLPAAPRRTGPYAACLLGSSQMSARQRFTDRLPAFGKCLGRQSLPLFRKPKSAETYAPVSTTFIDTRLARDAR